MDGLFTGQATGWAMDDPADPTVLGDLAAAAARAGGTVALDAFRTDLEVRTKTDAMDAVTAADLAAQERVIETIRDTDPDAAIVAEEADAASEIPASGRAWIIDPIDGTNNYAVGGRLWATCVACVEDETPVAAVTHLPAMDDTYRTVSGATRRNGEPVAVRDRSDPRAAVVAPVFGLAMADRPAYSATSTAIVSTFGDLRQLGSGQTALAMVAAGELDGVVTTLRHSPWDTVAGAHLVRKAGGRVTDANGADWRADSHGLVASNGRIHDALLEVAQHGLDAEE